MTHSYPNPSGTEGGAGASAVGGGDGGFSEPAYYETTAEPLGTTVPPLGDDTGSGTTQKAKDTAATAKDEAANVGQGAAQAGQQVAGVAKEQAANVASEAKGQALNLLHQSRSELSEQAISQQQRVAAGLRSLGDELTSMAHSSDAPGVASDLANQAAERTHQVAGWLENRDPGQLVQELQSFARRRPGAFLLAAAGLGLVGGRMTRGLVAAKQDDSQATPALGTQQYQQYSGQQYASETYPAQTYPAQGYPAETYPGQTYAGQGTAGEQYPGQAYQAPADSGNYYGEQAR